MANERTAEIVRAVAPAAIGAIGSAVTATKKFNVRSVLLCNLLATNQTVRLRIGSTSFLLFDYVVPPATTVNLTGLLCILAAGEQFQASTTTSGGVQIIITGVEEDA